ncbi:Transposon Tf2-6 polyprotein [Hypsizygus marmoreus]|uniref:Transposon Tf2-6 polyprotein n=1 Tax=Hypsizygus marmoreus TaxID=39966 RepID=A0A369JGW3_HYPMA|nr:Transposon Tf2-6 polyprotein [Hypsizygus marmoreus]
MREVEHRRSHRLRERREEREIEAAEMVEATPPNHQPTPSQNSETSEEMSVNIMLGEMILDRNADPPPATRQDQSFIRKIRLGYASDKLFELVQTATQDYPAFKVREKLIWTTNLRGDEVVCVPRDRALITLIIEQAHSTLGHFGEQRTTEYIRRWYWWPGITNDGGNNKSSGKLHSPPIPTKPWDSIGMDFIGPFPEAKGFNYLWVIICRMTSMVHLILVHTTMTASQLSWIYLREVVRLHGLPSSIVSDRDSKFTSKWWRELHKIMGAKLLMSTSFRPQTDGQTERANRSIGQIFRTVVRHDQKDWVDRVDLTEFAINASVSETTKYAPFELNGGHMPSMLREIRSDGVIPKGIKAFAERALQNLADAHDSIIEARVFQTRNANKVRRQGPNIKSGELVYLSTKNLNLPKGRARKLCPKFVGPYKVLKAYPETSTYRLELPTALQARRINPTFHISLLRPYYAASDALFPNRAHPEPYDFGAPDEQEWFVDELIGHQWTNNNDLEFQVRWSLGDTTWEPLSTCKDLAALDRYLELQGVKRPRQLARR